MLAFWVGSSHTGHPHLPTPERGGAVQPASRSCAGDAFPYVDAPRVQQGNGLGAQGHRTVMPINQRGQHLFFVRSERPTATGIDEGVEEDAIFDRGLAMTDARKSLVVERDEGTKGRGKIVRQGVLGGDGRRKRKGRLIFERALMQPGTTLKVLIHPGGQS